MQHQSLLNYGEHNPLFQKGKDPKAELLQIGSHPGGQRRRQEPSPEMAEGWMFLVARLSSVFYPVVANLILKDMDFLCKVWSVFLWHQQKHDRQSHCLCGCPLCPNSVLKFSLWSLLLLLGFLHNIYPGAQVRNSVSSWTRLPFSCPIFCPSPMGHLVLHCYPLRVTPVRSSPPPLRTLRSHLPPFLPGFQGTSLPAFPQPYSPIQFLPWS